jgi:hypothetical protein
MCRAVAAHANSDPAFAAHLEALQTQRRHINERLRMRLQQIYRLAGYSGPRPSSLPVALASDGES